MLGGVAVKDSGADPGVEGSVLFWGIAHLDIFYSCKRSSSIVFCKCDGSDDCDGDLYNSCYLLLKFTER